MPVAPLHHGPGGGAGAEEGTLEIGVEDVVPGFGGQPGEEVVSGDAGVVDEHVDAVEGGKVVRDGGGGAHVEFAAARSKDLGPEGLELLREGGGENALASGEDDAERVHRSRADTGPERRAGGMAKGGLNVSGHLRGRDGGGGVGFGGAGGTGIDDDGVGFVLDRRAAELAHIFDRFVQGNVAEREGDEGSGTLFGRAFVDEVDHGLAFGDFLGAGGEIVENVADGGVSKGDLGNDKAGEAAF